MLTQEVAYKLPLLKSKGYLGSNIPNTNLVFIFKKSNLRLVNLFAYSVITNDAPIELNGVNEEQNEFKELKIIE